MSSTCTRQYGKVFDDVAAEYDRSRPTYPDQLVDRACEVAGLGRGDHVLEIGCGTGQLTRSLVARHLQVTALDPGQHLLALVESKLKRSGEVELLNARFEDARLPDARFRAVFSAAALQWIDPAVGWRKIARVLAPGGTLALLQYFGLQEQRSIHDQNALLLAMKTIAPEIAADWPVYRDLAGTVAGAERRHDNVSEVWAWLGSHDVARPEARDLFGDVRVAAAPTLLEHTADELNALLRTASFYQRISPAQRRALEDESAALYERIGRPIRSSTVAVLVTARRSADA